MALKWLFFLETIYLNKMDCPVWQKISEMLLKGDWLKPKQNTENLIHLKYKTWLYV